MSMAYAIDHCTSLLRKMRRGFTGASR
jgi:hypothetical protein